MLIKNIGICGLKILLTHVWLLVHVKTFWKQNFSGNHSSRSISTKTVRKHEIVVPLIIKIIAYKNLHNWGGSKIHFEDINHIIMNTSESFDFSPNFGLFTNIFAFRLIFLVRFYTNFYAHFAHFVPDSAFGMIIQNLEQKSTIRGSRARYKGMIWRALVNIESQLSNALRIRSISHFPASISSIEVISIFGNSTLLGWKQHKLIPSHFLGASVRFLWKQRCMTDT